VAQEVVDMEWEVRRKLWSLPFYQNNVEILKNSFEDLGQLLQAVYLHLVLCLDLLPAGVVLTIMALVITIITTDHLIEIII
jgi:hypothetical protein